MIKSLRIPLDKESLEKLDLPVFVKNLEGVYIYCNQAFADFLGISKVNILGYTVYDIAPKKLADLYFAADNQLLDSACQQAYKSCVQVNESEERVIFSKAVIYTQQHDVAGLIGAIDVQSKVKKDGCRNVKKLTSRELEVLKLLVQGQSAKAIAINLGISCHTVTGYLKSIYLKLGAHSKNEALFKALTLFTITP